VNARAATARVARQGVHGALLASMAWSARRFAQACQQTMQAQTRAWRRVQDSLVGTQVAQRFPDVTRIEHPGQLDGALPISTWDDIADDVSAMAHGAVSVRTRHPIVRFERSGGSSGAQKLIPMTQPFVEDLQRGLSPWLFDLYRHHPALRSTSSYWSISPIGMKATPTPAGIPVGAVDDSEYLPPPLRALLRQVLVAAPALAALPDVESCRYATLRLLIARPDLGLISVWSPTFLSLLLDALDADADRLLDDLARGTCRVPGTSSSSAAMNAIVQRLPLRPDPARAASLRRSLQSVGRLDPREVWPQLSVVSLWTDGESARFAADVAARLPGVTLQGKGLLATEGIVTVPLVGAPAPVLCVVSHVYEFRTDDGRVVPSWALREGDEAEVILSTTAGLLRYRMGDRVRVVGHLGGHVDAAPCLRFVGRTGAVSDLVGEKLAADFVTRVLTDVGAQVGRPRFALLAPFRVAPARYRLYVEGLSPHESARFGAAVDDALAGGHPYRYARQLGQLGPVEVVPIEQGLARFEAWRVACGQRAGDIKYPSLCLDDRCHAALSSSPTAPNAGGQSWA
jgi:hypothetical protein